MTKIIKILTATFILIIFFSNPAAAEIQENSDFVKDFITNVMQSNEIPGVAVELFIDGKPYSYYLGYANLHKKIKVTSNTIFEVGSVSKLMTSLLFAQEIDYAKMGLNDPLSKYVRKLPDTFDDISLQDLATHTSGLPLNVPANITSRQKLLKYFSTWSPEHNSQEAWIYSNVGIGMLGYALERVSHTNYNQLYHQNITARLHMQPIGLNVPAYLSRYYAQGYDEDGDAVSHIKVKLFPAAADLKASAGDMRRFLAAAIGLPGTPKQVFYPMRMTQTAYVKLSEGMQGLGWRIHPLVNVDNLLKDTNENLFEPQAVKEVFEKTKFYSNALIDKTGATNGFRTYIAVIPEKKTGIVILMNKHVANDVIVKAGRELLFKLNGIGTFAHV